MNKAVIGYTGFVGGTLCGQTVFDDMFNSSNMPEIRGKEYELIVCAGMPGAKWKANQEPKKDLNTLGKLISNLKHVKGERFVLISTVDVYKNPFDVDEDSLIDPEDVDPYGRHRFYLEEFVRENFTESTIVRLPGLFGKGLKKNLIFDLLNDNCPEWTHCESIFQFYNMQKLWADLEIALSHALPLVNIVAEPIKAKDIAFHCFGKEFNNITEKPPIGYNVLSKYTLLFGNHEKYMYSAEYTFDQIRRFVMEERGTEVK